MSGKTSDLYVVRMLGPPETWMVPEAAVSNPPRSSRRCSSPSTVDSAARRACYEQPGPALPGGRAAAGPGCTASGLSSALGQVASSTGAWLSAHPEAEAAVNTADENAIRTYFATHQAEWSELQGIASPLRSLRQSCPQQVSPGDVARLYDAMAS
jgi:heme-binding protein